MLMYLWISQTAKPIGFMSNTDGDEILSISGPMFDINIK